MSNRIPHRTALNRQREASQGQFRPALKHGAYSGMSLLPGEDPAEFEKLHKELVAEYAPTGQHEHEIVETIARLMWRKQCLWTYGLAEFARQRYSAILEQKGPQTNRSAKSPKELSEEEMREKRAAENDFIDLMTKLQRSPLHRQLAERQKLEEEHIQRELGAVAFELANITHVATTGYLMHELSIIDRIDGMIDRCLKRLLFVRGVKTTSPSLSAAPKRIGGSGSAASEVEKLPSTPGNTR